MEKCMYLTNSFLCNIDLKLGQWYFFKDIYCKIIKVVNKSEQVFNMVKHE